MNINDPIGDMITRIRNAHLRGKDYVDSPSSNLRINDKLKNITIILTRNLKKRSIEKNALFDVSERIVEKSYLKNFSFVIIYFKYKGGKMKFVVLGRYSNEGLAGFVKNPSDNRKEAAQKITEAAGGKLLEMMTLRGAYDFCAIIEGSDFETMAGMKMLMQSTGTIEDMNIMEAVDFNKAAEKAAKAAAAYRPVGK